MFYKLLKLTKNQQAFIEYHKKNPYYPISRIMYFAQTLDDSDEGYNVLDDKTKHMYSNRGNQLMRQLRKKSIFLTTVGKRMQAAKVYTLVKNEVKKIKNSILVNEGEYDQSKVLDKLVDNINDISRKTMHYVSEPCPSIIKDEFKMNVLSICKDEEAYNNLIQIKTKDEVLKVITVMLNYSMTIVDSGEGSERKIEVKHPQLAFQCARLSAEMGGMLQAQEASNSVPTQSILEYVESKRIKELQRNENKSPIDLN